MSIFIKIDGATSDCKVPTHIGWIVADKMAFGFQKNVEFAEHSTASPIVSNPQNTVVTILKKMCSASGTLEQMSMSKSPFDFKMDLTKSMGHGVAEGAVYVNLEYKKAYITSYHLESNSSSEATEKITICYVSYTMKYITGTGSSAGYDFINHTKI